MNEYIKSIIENVKERERQIKEKQEQRKAEEERRKAQMQEMKEMQMQQQIKEVQDRMKSSNSPVSNQTQSGQSMNLNSNTQMNFNSNMQSGIDNSNQNNSINNISSVSSNSNDVVKLDENNNETGKIDFSNQNTMSSDNNSVQSSNNIAMNSVDNLYSNSNKPVDDSFHNGNNSNSNIDLRTAEADISSNPDRSFSNQPTPVNQNVVNFDNALFDNNNNNNNNNDADKDNNIHNDVNLDGCIRRVADFPKPGIIFYDITTLLKNSDAFRLTIKKFANRYRNHNVDAIVGAESRGFIFGAALAYELGCSFILARKPGKLPSGTLRAEYELEYGKDAIEIHKDSIKPGMNVLIIDDLIATGGTIKAVASLVEHLGGKILELAFVIDLVNLHDKDIGYPYHSLLSYEVDE